MSHLQQHKVGYKVYNVKWQVHLQCNLYDTTTMQFVNNFDLVKNFDFVNNFENFWPNVVNFWRFLTSQKIIVLVITNTNTFWYFFGEQFGCLRVVRTQSKAVLVFREWLKMCNKPKWSYLHINYSLGYS